MMLRSPASISHDVPIDELKECKLFQGASDQFLTRFATEAATECFLEGAIIVNEGGIADKLYCLIKGEVAVVVGPEEKIVAKLSAVCTFGEMAAKTKTRNEGHPVRTATVKASGFCVCRILEYRSLERMLSDYPNERQIFRKMAERSAAAQKNAKQKPKGLALARNAALEVVASKRLNAGILKRRSQEQHRERIAENFKDMEGMELSIKDFLHLTKRDAELRHRIESFMDIHFSSFEHAQNAGIQKWCAEVSTIKSGTLSFNEFIEGVMTIRDKRSSEIAEAHSVEFTTLTEDVIEKSEEQPHNGYHVGTADSKLSGKKSVRAPTHDSVSTRDASPTSRSLPSSQIGARSIPSSPQGSSPRPRLPSQELCSRQSSREYAWSRQSSYEAAELAIEMALSPRSRRSSRGLRLSSSSRGSSRDGGSPLSLPRSRSCAETVVNELRMCFNARPVIPPAIRRG